MSTSGLSRPGAITRTDGPAPQPALASNEVAPVPVLADSKPIVEVDPVVPAPALGEAEIERIEFGSKAGRIGTIEGKRGTTTVIWISEDEPPVGRSL